MGLNYSEDASLANNLRWFCAGTAWRTEECEWRTPAWCPHDPPRPGPGWKPERSSPAEPRPSHDPSQPATWTRPNRTPFDASPRTTNKKSHVKMRKIRKCMSTFSSCVFCCKVWRVEVLHEYLYLIFQFLDDVVDPVIFVRVDVFLLDANLSKLRYLNLQTAYLKVWKIISNMKTIKTGQFSYT